jgi:hypothetical protein
MHRRPRGGERVGLARGGVGLEVFFAAFGDLGEVGTSDAGEVVSSCVELTVWWGRYESVERKRKS